MVDSIEAVYRKLEAAGHPDPAATHPEHHGRPGPPRARPRLHRRARRSHQRVPLQPRRRSDGIARLARHQQGRRPLLALRLVRDRSSSATPGAGYVSSVVSGRGAAQEPGCAGATRRLPFPVRPASLPRTASTPGSASHPPPTTAPAEELPGLGLIHPTAPPPVMPRGHLHEPRTADRSALLDVHDTCAANSPRCTT